MTVNLDETKTNIRDEGLRAEYRRTYFKGGKQVRSLKVRFSLRKFSFSAINVKTDVYCQTQRCYKQEPATVFYNGGVWGKWFLQGNI